MNATHEVMRRKPPDPGEGNAAMGAAVGALGTIIFSSLLVLVRSHFPNAEFALALVIPVLLTATLWGRVAGGVTAVVAALCFDFMFTQPYLSLRIASKDDVATFVMLLIVALVAAEVGIRARRGSASARESRAELARLLRVAELSAGGAELDDIVSSARAELIGLFDLLDCVYEQAPRGPELPRLGNRGALENSPLVAWGEFILPTGGVEVPVRARGRDLGRLVLYAARRDACVAREATRRGRDRRRTGSQSRRVVTLGRARGRSPLRRVRFASGCAHRSARRDLAALSARALRPGYVRDYGSIPASPPLRSAVPASRSDARRSRGSRSDDVVAAVDVDDLAGGGGKEVGKQRDAGGGDRCGVLDVPAERCPFVPDFFELLEAGDAARGDRADRPGGHEVDSDALGSEIAREIPRGRLERGFGHAHPVVDRPCHPAVVEVEARRSLPPRCISGRHATASALSE